jgi:hypothetical protein
VHRRLAANCLRGGYVHDDDDGGGGDVRGQNHDGKCHTVIRVT